MGSWTEGGVCLGGIFISSCAEVLSVSKHFLFKRVRKKATDEANIHSEI